MSRTEKSHFRKFGFKSAYGGRAELKLFEIIRDGQRRNVANLDLFVRGQYARTKRNDFIRMRARLFDSLLNSISDHHRAKHDVYQFSSIILHSRVLAEKDLLKDARKVLRKGLKLANEQQKPQWELILAKEMSFIDIRYGHHEDILKTIDQQLTSLKHSEQLTQLARCYELAFHTQRTLGHQQENKKQLEKYLRKIESTANKIDLQNSLPAAQFNRIMIRQIVAHTLTETEAALRHTEEAFQFVSNYPEMTIGRAQLPVALLSNLINDGMSSFQFHYYDTYIETLRGWPASDAAVKRFAVGQLFRTEANAALYFGQFHRWKEFFDRLLKLTTDQLLPHVRWAQFGQLLHMMFADSAIRTCIRETNRLLYETKENPRQDLVTNLELLLAVCHYELENHSTAQNILDSAKSRLTMKDQFSESDKIVMLTLKKLMSHAQYDRKDILRESASMLSNYELKPVGFFDPIIWIQSKAETRPYKMVYTIRHNMQVR